MSTKSLSTLLWDSMQSQASARRQFGYVANQELSYAQLVKTIKKLSGFFAQHSIERIAIVCTDECYTAEIMLAALLNGVVFTVLDGDIKQPRFDGIIQRFKPDHIFVDEMSALTVSTEFTITSKAKPSSILSNLFGQSQNNQCYPYILKHYQACVPNVVHNNTQAYVLFTSGTTSKPKGVMISVQALASHLATLKQVYQYSQHSHILNALQLSHADGLVQGPILAAYLGIKWSHLGQFDIANAESIFDHIVAQEVTHFITVPVVLALLNKYGPSDDAFSGDIFYCVVSTGGALSAQLWQSFEQKYATKVSNLYGLTETCVGGVFTTVGDAENSYGRIGRPVDMQYALGSPFEPQELNEGLLWLSGDNIMDGYLDAPKETVKVLVDGWLNTGDIAKRHEDGSLSIIGREKELINAGGYAVYPQEINESLCSHPDVENAYTTSRIDDLYGEYIVSLVATSMSGSEPIIAHVRSTLEAHKVPRSIYITDKLPLGPSGKVIKASAEALIDEKQPQIEVAASQDEDKLLAIAAKIFNLQQTELSISSSSQNTPGWDSLGHLMLVTEAEEQFGVQLTPIEIMKATSLQQLLALIISK
ncbi:AMP-binding protein [Shewanella sp. Scap07]|uniref:AMP-binding protein n=1 Tax=Shewanella sp. Scap07 TaxID=2589987 RepID=UPI0015BCB4A6|nr:AMP-binding protein [Shewanella sp. Scap07]